MFARLRARNPGRGVAALLGYQAIRALAEAALRLTWRVRRRGHEHVPTSGPLLIAVNHQSHLDAPAVGCGMDRHVNFIARQGLFKNPLFGSLIRLLNARPIKESGSDTAAIRESLALLAMGRCVLIFPEGSRSPDGTVRPFKRGVWLLLSKAKCPVLPVAVEGAFDAWPRGQHLPRLFGCRLAVRYGQPIPPEQLLALPPDQGLNLLRTTIDTLRLEARADLRHQSRGQYPAQGPADAPSTQPPSPKAPTQAQSP
jgi:1-acyl-sn-glycerol-3-phosphate acyltransferase